MRLLNKVKVGCGLLGHLTVHSGMVIGQEPCKFYQPPFEILLGFNSC